MSSSTAWLVRRAALRDEALLLAWRNDPAARSASHSEALVTPEMHRRWFAAALANSERRIFIAELDSAPVAMARLDREAVGYQLSWYVAADARGRGVGRRLLADVLAQLRRYGDPGPVRAEIKPDNAASIRVAEAAGLRLEALRDGVLHFRA